MKIEVRKQVEKANEVAERLKNTVPKNEHIDKKIIRKTYKTLMIPIYTA